MNLAEAIKKCSMEAFDAALPCDVLFGTVEGTDPLSVKTGDMLLPEEVVSICEHLLYKKAKISFGIYESDIVINEGITIGDVLVMLRKKGGEGYIAIGKI